MIWMIYYLHKKLEFLRDKKSLLIRNSELTKQFLLEEELYELERDSHTKDIASLIEMQEWMYAGINKETLVLSKRYTTKQLHEIHKGLKTSRMLMMERIDKASELDPEIEKVLESK